VREDSLLLQRLLPLSSLRSLFPPLINSIETSYLFSYTFWISPQKVGEMIHLATSVKGTMLPFINYLLTFLFPIITDESMVTNNYGVSCPIISLTDAGWMI
jgi:hypothetical protein